MDYTAIIEEINRFNTLLRDDILKELQPIIKAYKYVKLKALENKQN